MEEENGGEDTRADTRAETRAAGRKAVAAVKAMLRKAREDKVVGRMARAAKERDRPGGGRSREGKTGARMGGDGLVELLGSKLRLKILLLMLKSGPVYSLEIVQLFEKNLFAVQHQLARMEKVGILRAFEAHRRTYYDLAETHPLHGELTALLEKHLQGLPWREQSGYYMSPDLKKRENLLASWY